MVFADAPVFGLVLRGHPYRRRAVREDLDTALAAAATDFGLEIFFLGAAVLQLAARRDVAAALLPAGYRGWSALPDLGEAGLYAEPGWLERCKQAQIDLIVRVEPLDPAGMRAAWRRCRHLMAF